MFSKSTTYAQKSDIARYEILYHYGGIYVDCDIFSIQNIEQILNHIDFFSGYESEDFIAIGLMGFEKNNIYLKHLVLNLELNYCLNINNSIPNQTGPVYFTNFWKHFLFQQNLMIHNLELNPKFKFFEPSYFYNYTYQDKYNKKPILFNKSNYCYHSWGYSWNIHKLHKSYTYYYLLAFLNNEQNNENNENKNKYENCRNIQDLSNYLKQKLFFKPNNHFLEEINFENKSENKIYEKNVQNKNEISKNRIRIIHIMGYFFTGGIERFILNIDTYGNHNKYEYILLFLHKKSIFEFEEINLNLNNISYFYFENHNELLNLVYIFNPSLIIDHYSQYFSKSIFKNNIYEHIIIHIIHSAIHYNNNIDNFNIRNCIHLYEEENKHISWKNIKNNYINTLGVKINNKKICDTIDKNKKEIMKKNDTLIIGIIGRICDEKIPLTFLHDLCFMINNIENKKNDLKNEKKNDLKNEKKNNLKNEKKNVLKIKIEIYGSFGNDFIYNDKFHNIIKNIEIIELMGQIDFDKIDIVYKKINYLLIPSKFETGSYVCLEALSYGIPVICRNNYGLRKIIKDGISGHLCNSDIELISKIKYLYYDNLINNYSIIYKESLKYNIKDKVNYFEEIMENHICENKKNLVIITSILNISDGELSYYHIRSVFNLEERVKQTLKTIETIREKIPNSFILFLECSNLEYNVNDINDIELKIKNNVDVFINCYEINEIKRGVNSKYKGLGENLLLLKGIEYINNEGLVFNNIFKISGRYYLNDDFDYHCFNNMNNQFVLWDNNFCSYASLFYKIKFKYLGLFHLCLMEINDLLKHGECLEIVLNTYFNQKMNYKNINILDKMNVSGYLSTEGYFFTI